MKFDTVQIIVLYEIYYGMKFNTVRIIVLYEIWCYAYFSICLKIDIVMQIVYGSTKFREKISQLVI